MYSLVQAKENLIEALSKENLTLSNNALIPLSNLIFSSLDNIDSSEEKSLQDEYITSLLAAHKARVFSGKSADPRKINANDIRTAMIILGRVLARSDTKIVSKETKVIILTMCPYC